MFAEKRNAYGEVVKASTALGENKALSVTPFGGVTYVHIVDNKKSTFVSLSIHEVEALMGLVPHIQAYNIMWHGVSYMYILVLSCNCLNKI
jgi:hypothetical protein